MDFRHTRVFQRGRGNISRPNGGRGEVKNFVEGRDFSSGGENLLSSDLDHANLFQC